MAYTNLPPNLYDYFSTINQRIRKLESAPDQAMTTAVSAQGTASDAYAQAINASIQATNAAYTAGVAYSSANGKNTTNYASYAPSSSSNNTNGTVPITGDLWFVVNPSTGYASDVYTYKSGSWGHSPLDGSSNVILNIDAGKLVAGTIIANVAISNGGGTFYVDRYGNLSATSASIQGTITATSGSFTGSLYSSNGTIAGFTLNSAAFSTASGMSISSSTGQIVTPSSITAGTTLQAGGQISNTAGGAVFNGGLNVATGSATIAGNLMVASMSSISATGVVWSSSNNRFYLTTSTERHKDNITPIPAADYLSKILQLEPVTFNYKPEFTDNPDQVISGLIAEKVAAIPEFATTVNLDKDGLPESLAYDRLAVFFIPALKQINDRLIKLEGANGTTTSN